MLARTVYKLVPVCHTRWGGFCRRWLLITSWIVVNLPRRHHVLASTSTKLSPHFPFHWKSGGGERDWPGKGGRREGEHCTRPLSSNQGVRLYGSGRRQVNQARSVGRESPRQRDLRNVWTRLLSLNRELSVKTFCCSFSARNDNRREFLNTGYCFVQENVLQGMVRLMVWGCGPYPEMWLIFSDVKEIIIHILPLTLFFPFNISADSFKILHNFC